MDDALGLNKIVEDKQSNQNWRLSNEGEPSRIDFADGLNRLQVIPQNEIRSDRPIIPATILEKLSFFRAYTSTVSKLEILCEQQNNVKRFLWFYVFNVLCKSLPMTYVYLFLSTYSPEHHFFIPKMVPLLYGFNFILMITSVFGLKLMVNNVSYYIAYFVFGIFDKIPWNRCKNKENIFYDYKYSCLDLLEFAQKISTSANVTYNEDRQMYTIEDMEFFTLAQIDYFDHLIGAHDERFDFNRKGIWFFILLFLWTTAGCLRNHISKRYTWQILNRAQLILCVFYTVSFLHLVITYNDRPINFIDHDYNFTNLMKNIADFDLLAESMTAPPVAHIIFSRSEDKVNPNLHSALINISNSIFYLLRASTSYLCKRYGENWVNASLIFTHFNYGSASIYFTWPIYFSTIYGGNFFVLLFFALNAVVDYFTFLITFQCFIQALLSEWKTLKPWCAACIILLAAVVEAFTSDTIFKSSFISWTCISTLSETIIVFWLYPLGRLIDDITFHFGLPPTKLRVWSFVVLPIFYSFKAFIIFVAFFNIMFDEENMKIKAWTFIPQSLLMFFGAIYIYFSSIYKKKRSTFRILTPVKQWGPINFKLRQLRKKYDSRKYIRSQAPRELSRHITEKIEKSSYKLEIIYEESRQGVSFAAFKLD